MFQAEDGIRDNKVTGVQTCALTISWKTAACDGDTRSSRNSICVDAHARSNARCAVLGSWYRSASRNTRSALSATIRSEERRVGKESSEGCRHEHYSEECEGREANQA